MSLSPTVTKLQDQLDGMVLTPETPGYDRARTVWNAMVDRRPRLIVRCANPADVETAIRYAREHDLELGIRCGGHSIVGHAIPEGGLVVDLTPMNEVTVDPARRRAWVEGGALLGALDRAGEPHGLATTAGNVSHTGVGGLTLGGGMGWLARQHGLTCDNVISFEVITADGRIVRASETEHPDLYWGLRGGGGNFGVVTTFEFQLHPVPDQTVQVLLTFPLDRAVDAFRGWRELALTAPRQATPTAWVGDVDGVPQVVLGFVWVGALTGYDELLADLRSIGRPLAEQVQRKSYLELQQQDDYDLEAPSQRRYWKGQYCTELSDEAIEAFIRRGTADGTGAGLPYASFQVYGGAIADVPDEATAFSQRDAFVEFVGAARWTDPAEDEDRIAAARRYGAAMAPFASGAYVNALTDEGAGGVRQAYGAAKLAKLQALKATWDPDNVFHLNHNIAPAAGPAVP
ncbi:FAD-binding oxidoreductase [Microlunatus parietis]|uniref:FAD/FMN-containing dehydrogenase n=1 Tax=Microlunatus parietis TaxID=682979 RepID=A0A7Y9I9I0_9ACTN|nr:FAD-binding oxidoreductase [Microlunatus parietis]NYE72740.1 FAD/FMN-containing dehydrogenase [Microlunatus parietis]